MGRLVLCAGVVGCLAVVLHLCGDALLVPLWRLSQSPISDGALVVKDNVDDQTLLSQLKEQIKGPSVEDYNFTSYIPGEYYSEFCQDKLVDFIFNGSTNLFAVEAGAVEGEFISNTVFLETARGWECLLIEANPHSAEEMYQKHRKCHVFNGGLSINAAVGTPLPFKLWSYMGGFVESLPTLIILFGRFNMDLFTSAGGGGVVHVKAYPLHMIMRALGRTVVDYWSLDTEGSEPGILERTDFGQIEVGVMTVEHNWEPVRRASTQAVMARNGFERLSACRVKIALGLSSVGEDWYASPAYFSKRGLPFPKIDWKECSSWVHPLVEIMQG